VLHLPARFRWVCLLVTVLSIGFIVAWQNPPPLSLTASVEPAVASSGEAVTFTFTVANTGDQPLDDVEVAVTIPQGAAFDRATADNQQWDIELSANVVRYRATGPFPADESAALVLDVTVRQEPGQSIVLDEYEAVAKGFDEAVAGVPLTIGVDAPDTVVVTPTVTATSTQTPAPSPTATRTPVATATPEPTPTPTITVVVAELPPTPTPNLSTEQEVVGTVTVLIFVGLVVVLIIFAVVWIVRNAQSA